MTRNAQFLRLHKLVLRWLELEVLAHLLLIFSYRQANQRNYTSFFSYLKAECLDGALN